MLRALKLSTLLRLFLLCCIILVLSILGVRYFRYAQYMNSLASASRECQAVDDSLAIMTDPRYQHQIRSIAAMNCLWEAQFLLNIYRVPETAAVCLKLRPDDFPDTEVRYYYLCTSAFFGNTDLTSACPLTIRFLAAVSLNPDLALDPARKADVLLTAQTLMIESCPDVPKSVALENQICANSIETCGKLAARREEFRSWRNWAPVKRHFAWLSFRDIGR